MSEEQRWLNLWVWQPDHEHEWKAASPDYFTKAVEICSMSCGAIRAQDWEHYDLVMMKDDRMPPGDQMFTFELRERNDA